MATADATGQSRLPKNSSQSTRPIIRLLGPPSRVGITNSPMAGMNTNIEPAITPGMDSGSVTSTKVRQGGLPRSAAASSRERSSFSKVEQRQNHERQVRIDDAEIDRKGGSHDLQRVIDDTQP